jgi:hypothetical protein
MASAARPADFHGRKALHGKFNLLNNFNDIVAKCVFLRNQLNRVLRNIRSEVKQPAPVEAFALSHSRATRISLEKQRLGG